MNVAVVGAGLAGLAAASDLLAAHHDVVVIEQARSVGGRLATRRIGPALLDHGAQFFTVRTDAFAADVARWSAEGLVYEWNRGFGHPPDGHPRYAVRGGLQALAARLASGVDVRTGWPVRAVERHAGRWRLRSPRASIEADAVVLTPPAPEAVTLLTAGDVDPPAPLRALRFSPVLAVLLVLDGPSAVPPPGGVQLDDGPFTFVADNAAKGLSPVPALTLHASPAVSADRWAQPDGEALAALVAAARPWVGTAGVVHAELRRWPHATPAEPHPAPSLDVLPGLVCAGDAFGGPRVEGAYRSGRAAAARLMG